MNNAFLETIKADDGEIFNISYHQKRYESVLSSFGITQCENLQTYLHPPQNGLYRCRLIYTLETIFVTYHPYTKRDIKTLKLVYDDTIEYSVKYENRSEIDELFLQKDKGDDILIIKNSLIRDTSIANIAFFDGEKWLTPSKPLLKGTTRERYLAKGKIFEADIAVDDLKKYKKVALLNAMIDFDIITEDNTRKIYC